ncbi:alpha/beta fold hydrolase [Hyphococcus flavus]|uniref:Alpha/beta fold hydrolase n=1 Tax=Hyphococcus flavus TaxID=1866326 RepID=A0AAF0CEN0_9PROT|nr:alpha/beta fold hydrolase [Hyphococcus flavus]WDI30464.1 alpha/beta fold hydrolase [Hyphococcus flavus]
MRKTIKARVMFIAAVIFAGTMFLSTAKADALQNCSDVTLPVSIIAGGPKIYSLYGKLCHPGEGPSATVQVLVHGYTYDHRYWALPGFGDDYDYVKVANEAGFTTFAIDRLGSAGGSSRPPSALMTLQAGAVTLHDVVSAARDGGLPGGPYENVITVGHSAGTAIAWIEASLFQDVDGIIATGFGHPFGAVQGLVLNTLPAFLDSRLRPLVGLDLGYLTTTPGSREGLFYRVATSDPAVIAYDEATKGLGTSGEFLTLSTAELGTLAITAPVLFVMGQYDQIFCFGENLGGFVNCASDETLYASERIYFPLVTDFEAYVHEGAGHNINLHDGATNWFDRAADWASARFSD